MDAYEIVENCLLSSLLIVATCLMLRKELRFIFRKRHKKTFIEQEYAREGRKCPSEAPGGPVTPESICSNDICKAVANVGVSAEEAQRGIQKFILNLPDYGIENEKEL